MTVENYHTSISVNATIYQAFESINSVSKWWSANFEGNSEKLAEVFTVRFGETYITLKIVELIPDKKIVWLVTDCNKPWLKNKKEWRDTKISWQLSTEKNLTQISFTHIGLVPEIECFSVCSNAWNQYLHQSLLSLITSGKGQPEPEKK